MIKSLRRFNKKTKEKGKENEKENYCFTAAFCSAFIVIYFCVADEKDDRIAELEETVVNLESENEELRATIAELEEKLSEATPKSSNQDEYKIGETWIVEGQ